MSQWCTSYSLFGGPISISIGALGGVIVYDLDIVYDLVFDIVYDIVYFSNVICGL